MMTDVFLERVAQLKKKHSSAQGFDRQQYSDSRPF
jgi:hypothetical protein